MDCDNISHSGVAMIFVDYANGFNGEFVLTLIHLMNDPTHSSVVNPSGSAHNNRPHEKITNLIPYKPGAKFDSIPNDTKEFKKQYDIFLDNVLKLDYTPVVFKAHTFLHQQDLINEGNTVITICAYDKQAWVQIAANICWKVMVHEFDTYGKRELYNILEEEGIEQTGTLFDLTEFQYYKVIKNLYEGNVKKASQLNSVLDNPEEQWMDELFIINFSDFYTNKEKVLNTLERATGLKVNEAVHDFYNRYMEAQKTADERHTMFLAGKTYE